MRLRLPYLSTNKGDTDATREDTSMLEDRWSTLICLVGIFVIAFFIRSYFALEMSTKFGTPFLISGGSDAYYYERIVEYIAYNNRHLLFDPMINYPIGVRNPRPPMYGWTTVLSAYVITPFVGDFTRSLHYSFILSTPFWGALTIFPVYLVGRDIYGKKAGIAAAFLLAISAGHLQRSPIGNGDHDAIYLFFAIAGFYYLMKALKGIPDDVSWVERWNDKELIKKGVRSFIDNNRKSLLYAAMAGMCFATVALSWQGWAYIVVILLTYYYIQLLIDRVRYRDSLGVTACVMISLVMCAALAAPFYYGASVGASLPYRIGTWYDVPLILIIAGLAGGIILTVSRDYPWILIYSILAAIVGAFLLIAVYISPALMEVMLSGAGYFARTKAYETIAEAQAPEFSNLVLSFGPATFFLSVLGIALSIWHLKGNWRTDFLFILVWTGFAIYMAMSAARFIFNGSPAFALTAGWITALLVDKSNFDLLARKLSNLRGDIFGAIKRGITVTHVLSVLFIVFLLLTPNIMSGFDAGIPFENKRDYDKQVHQSLPSFLRPEDYNVTTGEIWHLGAFGFGLDKPTDYWPAAWSWLKEKNDPIPPEDRPGFLSWWDYGFESVQRGKTPAVADNFLWGHRLAGNVLMAQNESEVISLLIVRMLEAPYREDGAFVGETRDIMVKHLGEETTDDLEHAFKNPGAYREEVLSNPDRYHPRADDISDQNLRYARTMGLLSYEQHETLVELYYDITEYQDKIIQYLAVDTRLFPFSGRQTGIFYAPAKLSDHRIDEAGGTRSPYDFYTITLVDDQGNHYDDPETIPPGVNIVDYGIDFKPMFYNSMLYRIFVGYAGHWVGEEESIPGVDTDELQPMPGWNLNNFRLSYRTAYYNPYPEDVVRQHQDEWRAVSFQEALEYHEAGEGTVDLSARSYLRQGVVMLEYYHGAIVSGTVKTEEGTPVPEARVTILDETGTPHGTTFTDKDGYYETYAPYGELTLVVSTGGMDSAIHQMESINLGMSSFNVTRDQAMRKRVDRTGDGRWDYLIEENFVVDTGSISGHVYIDVTGDGEYTPQNDTLIPANITVTHQNLDIKLFSGQTDGSYTITDLVPGVYTVETDVEGLSPKRNIAVQPGSVETVDFQISTGSLFGKVYFDDDMIESIDVEAEHVQTGKTFTTLISEEGNYTISNLVPGSYSIGVANEDFTLRGGRVVVEVPANQDVEQNLTVSKAITVSGQTRRDGRNIPNQRLIFTSTEDAVTITTTSDSDGYYNVKLPYGEYMIYGTYQKNNEHYAYLGNMQVSTDAKDQLNVNFQKAYLVSGNVAYENQPQDGFAILFSKEESQLMVPTNKHGDYSTILPQGDYTVYGWRAAEERTLVYRSIVPIRNDMRMDITPKLGVVRQGQVFRDMAHEEDVGIHASITLTFEDQISVKIRTGPDGDYQLVIPRGETTVFKFERKGYHPSEMSYHPDRTFEEEMYLTARDIPVSGSISSNHVIPDALPLLFDPIGSGAVEKEVGISGSSYSASVQPGDYTMTIEYSPSEGEMFSFTKNISMVPGDPKRVLDIHVDYRVEVEFNIMDEDGDPIYADIEFIGPETKSVSFNGTDNIYLKPGTYMVRASNHEQELVNMTNLVISTPSVHEMMLHTGVNLSPIVSYDTDPKSDIPVWIVNLDTGHQFNMTTDEEGRFSVLLAPGNYEVYVEHSRVEVVDGVNREVIYTYTQTYDLKTSTSPAIQMERQIIHPTFSGKLLIDGQGVGNILLEFTGNSPEAISTSVTTNGKGEFELDMSRGLYTVYAYYTGPRGLYAVMYEFEMPDEDHELEISMEEASTLTGVIRKLGEGVPAEITISSLEDRGETSFFAQEDGRYDIILPAGQYEIHASKTVLENDMDTVYRYERDLDLRFSMELNIYLEREARYGVRLLDLDEKTAEPGTTLVFKVPVVNTGNTDDEYVFSSPAAIWPLEYEPSRLKVPAGETRDVTVKVQIDVNASVSHPPISFIAESVNSNEQADKRLPIRVLPHYGVNIHSDVVQRSLDRGVLKYLIDIENTGNDYDTYNIRVLNSEYLRANGWEVSVINRTESMVDGGIEEVELTLKAITSRPASRISVKIEAVSENDPSISDTQEFEVIRPSLISDLTGVTLTGDDITLDREVFSLSTGQWALLVVAAIVAGFYIVKKRRWL